MVPGGGLNYYNRTSNTWIPAGTAPGAVSLNALGAFGGTGSLYFSTANTRAANPQMVRADLSNALGTITFATIAGAITIPAGITYTNSVGTVRTATTGNYIGASFDNLDNVNRRMYVLASGTAPATDVPQAGTSTLGTTVAMLGILDPEFPTLTSWKTIISTTATGTVTYPITGTSGDIYFDRTLAQVFYITNTTPIRFMKLTPNTTGFTMNSVLVASTATFTVAGVPLSINTLGLGLDPTTNRVYFHGAGGNNYILDAGAQGNTPAVNSTLASAGGTALGDTGSCIDQPLVPTVVKSFNPSTSGASIGTSTVTVTINNPNKVPIFTNAVLTDAFPANMVVANPLSTSVQCFTDGGAAIRPSSTTITAVVGATSFSIPSGAFIAGGGTSGGSCSFSVVASTTVAEIYPNTIPAGSLTTTAGDKPTQAQATYTLRISDFQGDKSQRVGTSGATTTLQITVPGGATMQYILTVTNLGPLTASTTFTDTIPSLLTPSVAAVTAVASGGGTCTIATAVVSGQLQVTGVFSSAPSGAFCTITITQRGSSTLATLSSATNTITVSGSPTFTGGQGSDRTTANNTATVITNVGPSTNLQITKTNGVTTFLAGSTSAYTVTISNLGPAAAPGSTFLDPTATGLDCTTVIFASTPAASVTVAPFPLTLSAVQVTGVTLTAFPSGSTATFRVTCGVTATGQ